MLPRAHPLGLAIAFAAIILIALPPRLSAQSLPVDPVGARHMAMGGASAALWSQPEAIYHNPASLVWQTVTLSAGLQPVQFVRGPKSWWAHYYNEETEYGVPVAVILQGWDYPTPSGRTGQYMTAAMPLALNLTPATPGAATVHFAFERRDDGRWKFNVPLDLGFLARHPSGATLGIAAKGLTFGNDGFESVDERVEYGVSWGGGGPYTLASSFIWRDGLAWDEALDSYRVGGEIGGDSRVHLLGGYIHEPDRWYATGGLALRSDETGRYEFIYSVVYDHDRERVQHFLQYGLRFF